MHNIFKRTAFFSLILAVVLKGASAVAYEVNDRLSINGILAGTYQYQILGDSSPDYDNAGRGTVPFQAEVSFTPT